MKEGITIRANLQAKSGRLLGGSGEESKIKVIYTVEFAYRSYS